MTDSLFENIVIVNLVMMPYKMKLSMVGVQEFENDSVRNIHAKTPDPESFRVQFFDPEGRMKGIALEEVRFFNGLLLDGRGKGSKELVKRGGGGYLHLVALDNLGQGFSFGDSPLFMVFFRLVQSLKKIIAVKSGRVAKRFKVLLADFQVNALWGFLGNLRFEFWGHT